MSDFGTESNPKALFADPRLKDIFYAEKDLRKEVVDFRPLETGDLILKTITHYEDGKPTEKSASITLATFKPDENPDRFILNTAPFPESRDKYIGNLHIFDVNGEGDGLDVDRHSFLTITESEFVHPFNDNNPPPKAYNVENYAVTTYRQTPDGRKKVVLDPPVLKLTSSQKILDPVEDLPLLSLTTEERAGILENARTVRQYLADNLLDQPDFDSTGLTDPRLHQLDNLINTLSTQNAFKVKKATFTT